MGFSVFCYGCVKIVPRVLVEMFRPTLIDMDE